MENKSIEKLINKIGNSYFNDDLINEITLCTILASEEKSDDLKSIILLNDVINSFLSMSNSPYSIVATQPMKLVQFSWWYSFINNHNFKSNFTTEFKNVFVKFVKSDFFENSEWPQEMKFCLYVNLYGIEYVKNNYKLLYDNCNKDFNFLKNNLIMISENTIKESLEFYHVLYKNNAGIVKRLREYGIFNNDNKIILFCDSICFANEINFNVNDDSSISELYGNVLFEEKMNER